MPSFITIITPVISTILLILLSVQLTFSQDSYSQKTTEKESLNVVTLEMLGHGFGYSFNYERVLFNNPFFKTSAQIGFAYYGKNADVTPVWIPITINQITKIQPNAYLEMGGGKIIRNDGFMTSDNVYINNYRIQEWILRLGYRYEHPDSPWVFKIAYTPFLNPDKYVHWGALGFGMKF